MAWKQRASSARTIEKAKYTSEAGATVEATLQAVGNGQNLLPAPNQTPTKERKV